MGIFDRVGGERTDYSGDGITEDELAATPYEQVRLWVDQAIRRQSRSGDVPEPTAMSVATADVDGSPNVRTMLMRLFDERGPGFVTNLASAKGRELAANPRLAATLTWPSMFRAIRFRGTAVVVDRAEVIDYFVTRPWGSRIGAWASHQSQPAADRASLEAAFDRVAERWPDCGTADDVPVPDFWGGYRILCDEVELWGGRRSRLHDRLVFSRVGEGTLAEPAAWVVTRRQP